MIKCLNLVALQNHSMMKEAFLHFVWRFQLFDHKNLRTVDGKMIEVIGKGLWNKVDAGPDFSMVRIKVEDQIWVGSVEMHVKSSDWDLHKHSKDAAYENVVLHVVYEHDREVAVLAQRKVPTLELKEYVLAEVVSNYQELVENNQQFIPCEKSIHLLQKEKLNFWLERLMIERLERKAEEVERAFLENNKNWEQLLFKKMAYVFGLKVNADAFSIWANSFEFAVLMKNQLNPDYVHALFFGQAGLLNFKTENEYIQSLQNDYFFLQSKYNLKAVNPVIFKFFRMRPVSFPTIRLMQLAVVYAHYQNLFAFLMGTQSIEKIKAVFEDLVYPDFWNNHYTLEKESTSHSKKGISKEVVERLIINVIIPMKFVYAKHRAMDVSEELLEWLRQLPSEKNSLIDRYVELGMKPKNALESQAYLELHKHFCNEKKCLNCAIGLQILKSV